MDSLTILRIKITKFNFSIIINFIRIKSNFITFDIIHLILISLKYYLSIIYYSKYLSSFKSLNKEIYFLNKIKIKF